MVERSEAFVRGLGFRVFRVRHVVDPEGGLRARVQIAPDEMGPLPELTPMIKEGLAAAGYKAVEIDPAGYRSYAEPGVFMAPSE
jgi:PP-loop superfamily ATP-utilizing enzyme